MAKNTGWLISEQSKLIQALKDEKTLDEISAMLPRHSRRNIGYMAYVMRKRHGIEGTFYTAVIKSMIGVRHGTRTVIAAQSVDWKTVLTMECDCGNISKIHKCDIKRNILLTCRSCSAKQQQQKAIEKWPPGSMAGYWTIVRFSHLSPSGRKIFLGKCGRCQKTKRAATDGFKSKPCVCWKNSGIEPMMIKAFIVPELTDTRQSIPVQSGIECQPPGHRA